MINAAVNTLSRIFGNSVAAAYGTRPGSPVPFGFSAAGLQPPKRLYELLRAMYLCNGLYDDLAFGLHEQGVWREALKPIRNPAYRVVEFYVSKLWPGTLPDALPIVAENERILDPIAQVWAWSNWASQKQVFVRWLAMYGDVFVKVATRAVDEGTRSDRVYFQLIDPQYVVAFDTDERGYLTYIRVDVPRTRRDGDTVKKITYTEVWDKATGIYRTWEHEKGDEPNLEQLGTPKDTRTLADFGIDFLPFVHCMFRDIGEERGQGAYTHAIDKIDEANRIATRLHQQLFRNIANTWVLEGSNALVRDGRSLPSPQVQGMSGSTTDNAGTLTLPEDQWVRLPSGWVLKSAVPDLPYDAALNILNAHMLELEHDMPELAYYRVRDLPGDASGRAVRLRLSDAIDNVIEARGNAEQALVRLHEMALTIGIAAGLFRDLGTYEEGAFAHDFEERDVLPPDKLEEAQARQAEVAAAIAEQQVMQTHLLRKLGYTDEEIDEIKDEREANAPSISSAADRLLASVDRGQE